MKIFFMALLSIFALNISINAQDERSVLSQAIITKYCPPAG